MNKISKLKVAIIGYGKMGKIRASYLLKYPDIKIVAICDVVQQQGLQEVPFVHDYKMVMDHHPDIVFVCVINKFLPDIVCYFLNQGVHVFCEKPPGRTVADVELMFKAQQDNPSVKLKFGFNHRYHQAVLDAKSIVDKGRLGRVLWLRGIYGKGGGSQYDRNWRNQKDLSGGGILIDQGIHMVDLFRLFCGDFTQIKSFINCSYWPIEVEDNAFVIMKNDLNQTAMLHSSATQWQYKFLLEIYMEKGYVTISGILSSTKNYGTETLRIARCKFDEEGYPIPNPEETITYYEEDNSWGKELEEFISCIKDDKPIEVGTCQEAYKTMLLIEQIYMADENWSTAVSLRK